MKRMLGIILAWLIVAAGHGAPVRPLYEPPDPPRVEPTLNLRGTVWRGKSLSMLPIEIRFQADGTLVYEVVGSKSQSPGSWSAIGTQVTFDINKYTDHRGTISGNDIRGDAVNRAGQTGTFALQRVFP